MYIHLYKYVKNYTIYEISNISLVCYMSPIRYLNIDKRYINTSVECPVFSIEQISDGVDHVSEIRNYSFV